MINKKLGGLAKLKIHVQKIKENGNLGEEKIFEAMYNPETYSQSYRVNYNEKRVIGGERVQQEFSSTGVSDVSFQLFFDATGASVNSTKSSGNILKFESLAKRLKYLTDIATNRDGDIHQTYKLLLNWGILNFPCRLTNLKIDYKLFSNTGEPIRAIANCTFIKDEVLCNEPKENGLKSADLTHVYLVKSGENLPMITERIYGNQKYYLEIARINNLKKFRKLVPGTEILLPPIDKQEN